MNKKKNKKKIKEDRKERSSCLLLPRHGLHTLCSRPLFEGRLACVICDQYNRAEATLYLSKLGHKDVGAPLWPSWSSQSGQSQLLCFPATQVVSGDEAQIRRNQLGSYRMKQVGTLSPG